MSETPQPEGVAVERVVMRRTTTKEIEVSEDELLEVLRTRLSINVQTSSEYTGWIDGPLYRDNHTIQLLLDGDVISEASL